MALVVVLATLLGVSLAETAPKLADPRLCGDGNWLYFENNCYTLLTGSYTWNQFWAVCTQEYNAVGATIFSATENQFVWAMFGGQNRDRNAWLGGNRIGREHPDFRWQDGTGMSYTNWAPGEPNNGGIGGPEQECMIIREDDGKWDDIECDLEKIGICKKAANVPLVE
ncbi:unnamed protein product [Owenia fusiformis]|uniref:Uncharacterized protein n=1 Tax=Owenia fusiformis TaxID=6347 RepID=A0A8J1U454_OWEFU|nr:unnamed protein product [Owenia fusiformis]